MIAWMALVACTGSPPSMTTGDTATQTDASLGPLGEGARNPFPSWASVGADGRLALPQLEVEGPGTSIPVGRLAWRTGFSAGQPAVLVLPGISEAGFPAFDVPEPGVGSVRMADLTAGRWLPCMAELDAHPDAGEDPALLVRPLTALPLDHEVAVVVTTDAVARPSSFDPERPSNQRVVAEVVALGLPEAEVAVAWSFPVADGTAPLRSALEQRKTADFSDPVFDEVRDAGTAKMPPLTWRIAEGSFETTRVLGDDGRLALERDGSVIPQQTPFEAALYVHIPESVAKAEPGTVPLMVFGHGIFQTPEAYFDVDQDFDGVLRLANEMGAIVVATRWRGLSSQDLGLALGVAGDFARLPEMTGHLVQSQLATREMIDALRSGTWFDDPVFEGASGQILPDPQHVSYYGISLGGIEGAVLMATDPPVDAAVLHVPGGMWSTMLERSSNWSLFEGVFVPSVPDAADRQRMYAVSQLWWDPVDPIAWTVSLGDKPVLLQEAIGDEQVPNLTTEALARGAGLPVIQPLVRAPELTQVALPLPDGSAALVQFDPELALPPTTNRPAPRTGAHDEPRLWRGQRGQARTYLDPEQPGQIVHLCGDTVCSASNPGL